MDWWYIVWVLLLVWSIPWLLLRISDGTFLLNQIFRFVFWGSFLISYELIELNLMYCYLLAHLPGVMIWGFYDSWVGEDDAPQKIGDEFEYGIPIENIRPSDSVIVLSTTAAYPAQIG